MASSLSYSRRTQSVTGRIAPYLLATALVAVATFVTRKTQPILGEISPLFFAAVVLSTWYGGWGPGLTATALAGWASGYYFFDIPAGTGVFWWDDALRLSVFLMVALLLSSAMYLRRRAEEGLKKANDDLENRVRTRTQELESTIAELKRLENQVLEISEQEQRRIGHDLHDGLGQELTGVAFLTQNLGLRLAEHSRSEAAEANRISLLINRAIEQTRKLARGLSPVELGADGLLAALRSLAAQVHEMCGIPCDVRLNGDVRVNDHNAAVHLYRIAQEALTNAVRHSRASRILISLDEADHDIVLTFEDNGVGIPLQRKNDEGLGLRLMHYRAKMIGATLNVDSRPGGTIIRCRYRDTVEADANKNGTAHHNEQESFNREELGAVPSPARG